MLVSGFEGGHFEGGHIGIEVLIGFLLHPRRRRAAPDDWG
jgi:hypothetical protein